MIGNTLQIRPELYEIFKGHARIARDTYLREVEAENALAREKMAAGDYEGVDVSVETSAANPSSIRFKIYPSFRSPKFFTSSINDCGSSVK